MQFFAYYITTYKYMMLEMIAVFYDVILLLYVFSLVKSDTESGKRFRDLAFMGTLLTFSEVLAPLTRLMPASLHVIKMYFDVFQFVFAFLSEVTFARYMMASCKYTPPKMVDAFNKVLVIITLVGMASSPFTGIISTYDEITGKFTNGPLYMALGYGPAAYFTLYSLFIFIINFKKIDIRERVFLFIAFGVIVSAAGLQPLMNGKIKLVGLFASFSVFILYLSLEASDYKGMVSVREELIEAERTANAANVAKSTFLANMSHEIRTPMNAILGMNDIILRNNTEPAILKYSSDMKKSGNELLQIINDVLDISKIEAGQLEIRSENYQLSTFVSNVSDVVKKQARDKGLSFNVHVDDDMPNALVGDPARLEQILVNLLNNAIKYTEKGSVDLAITGKIIKDKKAVQSEDRDEDSIGFELRDEIKVEFLVEDTGVGIKEEDISHIFDNFKRVDIEKNRSIQGAGLGLAIVKYLVEAMDGEIEVESYYGRGSRFTVSVTQSISGLDRYIDHVKVPVSRIKVDMPSMLGLRMLIIDDNDMNLTVMKSMMRSSKGDVVTVNNSYDGLRVIETEPFDIVFIDYMMPGLDGTDIYKKVMENREGVNHDVPFIIMSANMTNDDMAHYSELGFYYALCKPIQGEEVACLLEGMR
ncbi:MAG: response regulator [Lachnospiraceae bacterium]|nr:response regulator [Lachnospiraceae bacterium]